MAKYKQPDAAPKGRKAPAAPPAPDDSGAGEPAGPAHTTREPDAPAPPPDRPPPADPGEAQADAAPPDGFATLQEAVEDHLRRHSACPRWMAVDICRQAYPALSGQPVPRHVRRKRRGA